MATSRNFRSRRSSASHQPGGAPVPPAVPQPLDAATRAVFGALARLQSRRALHPAGSAFRGRLVLESSLDGSTLLQPGSHDVVLRVSRGAGLPSFLPDIIGIAVKVPDAYGPGRDQDLLFSSSGGNRLTRRVLVPAWRATDRPLSSILPLRIGSRRFVLGLLPRAPHSSGSDPLARVAPQRPVEFAFVAGEILSSSAPLGRLQVLEPLREGGEALRFDPWNTGGGIEPVGVLNALRKPAYESSREARGAD